MTTRVGINGFGRIGRALTRMALDRADFEVVAMPGALSRSSRLRAEEALGPVPVSLTLVRQGGIVDKLALRRQ